MRNRTLDAVIAAVFSVLASGVAHPEPTSNTPFPCFKHHGRLISHSSGSPSFRIWLIGTKRIVGLEDTAMPRVIERYLDATSPEYSFIYGDFKLCPLVPDKPGHMRSVRMVGAENLVVANMVRSPRPPPFRLLSTWTATTQTP
jgi:hypothetical protein